ncbi:DUF2189 domain-containing protein [Thioalkalivibrio sp.]|uniref:DUF2189 domain-containing protein n=1 Tax=Thioalkalivibrio sp. TaxID=2093813 RepID=UPI00397695A3
MKRAQRTLYPEDPSEVEPRRRLDTPPVRAISAPDALKRWLAGGWHDLVRAPAVLLHGLVVAALGALILFLSREQPAIGMIFIFGLLLLGPVLAVGVNEMARRLDQGGPTRFSTGLGAIRELGAAIWLYAAILIILFALWAGMVWQWIGVLTVGDLVPPATLGEVLGAMLASPQGIVSLLGFIAAAVVFALAVFAISLVTLPAMLDRQRGLVDAVATSLKALKTNPGPLLLWGLLITVLFAVSVATAFIALIVIFPWLGLSMWHGYRDLVGPSHDRASMTKSNPTHG